MQPLSWIGVLLFLFYASSGSADINRHRRQVHAGGQPGVCRYGRRLECCYGWRKNSKGQCEAQCEHGCKHGECAGPNKCKCYPGYAGKMCNQDLNECGLKPRPCEHRCMNTQGSYMCYCLNGHTLMPDGSCTNSRTCSLAHCQYGCEDVQGEIRCLCPSAGLQLGPDQRTCVDIDECVTGKNLCPYNRQCVNTFGSYYCKCQNGYDLTYVNGKYDCVDNEECATNTHRCSHHAVCLNTQGSYKCKCKQGFRGSGFECSVKPFYQSSWDQGENGSADDHALNAIPESPVRLDNEQIRNVIPEPQVTVPPQTRLQPFDYDGETYTRGSEEVGQVAFTDIGEEEDEEADVDNQLNSRGDVFIPEDFESVFDSATDVKEIEIAPGQEEFFMDCNFDQGACEWVQDKDDRFDWSVSYHENGIKYYMVMSGLLGEKLDQARLKLLLSDRAQQGGFCLTFNYRVTGSQVGTLRVLLNNRAYPVWEQSHSRGQDWQTELLTVAWKNQAPESIIFEAERGNGVGGEIGLDNVVLTSGSCQEEDTAIF
ncbi:epidermal growth factor-like protein 6 isoform X1 [Coregonus clupeaformis]|uniref:epidermal growth factor-like protein 6 isoform X1 n=1 Tax=Coregonus clupeaformis TaxID=59861 RepID=UPI001BE0B733|nr:epidermal growth factor-like protein 6 isoform X1 [Coregonus clupeaformis]